MPSIPVQAGDARGRWREVLDDVEHEGRAYQITRWHRTAGYLVPPDFYTSACVALGIDPPDQRATEVSANGNTPAPNRPPGDYVTQEGQIQP
jgi:hypothetical protein